MQSEIDPTMDEQRRAALRRAQARRGFQASVRAGETNAGTAYNSTAGTRTLLGLQ